MEVARQFRDLWRLATCLLNEGPSLKIIIVLLEPDFRTNLKTSDNA